jgi:hypothetical protein
MSRFSGPQGKGAARRLRELKRLEALERDKSLPVLSQRRRRYRRATQWLEEQPGS